MIKKIISLLFVLSAVIFSQNAKNIFDAINNNDLNRVKNIISSGGNVNAINKEGMTALIVASEKGNLEIVRELIKAGANVNGSNSVGWTPLMGASFEGNSEVVKELINSGANINAYGIKYRNTALMQAIRGENPEIVKILIEAGADINMKNANGETAYDKAMEVGLTEVTELLKPKSVNSNFSTSNISTNTKVIIMIIILLIIAIVVNIILRFSKYSDEEKLVKRVFTWGPIIFAVLNIVTPMDFINGVFEDIVFLLWAIGNSIHYKIWEELGIDNSFKITEAIKWIFLGIGLFIALTGGGIIIKGIYIIALILGIAILIILGALGFFAQGVSEVAKVAAPIVVAGAKAVYELVCATLESIAEYFNEYLADEYPNANYLMVNKIKHEFKAGNYNTINIGIYDDDNDLLGNEYITCESVDNNLREGQTIYI